MLIIMRTDASQKEITAVIDRVEAAGLRAHVSTGEEGTVIGAIGDGRSAYGHKDQFIFLSGVDRIVPISRPYKLAHVSFARKTRCWRIPSGQGCRPRWPL